jgi:hypothetical protein
MIENYFVMLVIHLKSLVGNIVGMTHAIFKIETNVKLTHAIFKIETNVKKIIFFSNANVFRDLT